MTVIKWNAVSRWPWVDSLGSLSHSRCTWPACRLAWHFIIEDSSNRHHHLTHLLNPI